MDATLCTFRLNLHLFLFTLGSFFHLVSSNNAFGQMSACCTYQDLGKVLFEYELQYICNKHLFMKYNSTSGLWKGFTPHGVTWAGYYNSDPDDAKLRKLEQMMLCSDTIHAIRDLQKLTAAPRLKLTSVKQSTGANLALLLCSAYRFYPQNIKLTWLKNGQEVTSDVTSTEVLSDGDLYFQIHSYLEYSPKPGEELSCMVEHMSLSEPLVQVWDPHHSLPWPERVKIIIGTIFLVVGLTTLAVGYVKHRKQSAALCTLMKGHQMVPSEVVQQTEASLD